ncbi:LysE family translocator [uncultured Tateyamaria sp.]|uniref:LysE family translocator n=1 Tax=uncultured Tateyamaria sp. TaxID=455651 RepID=UPI002609619E|nr:LysE family translocator [uncultured Tateyamaria sp.]
MNAFACCARLIINQICDVVADDSIDTVTASGRSKHTRHVKWGLGMTFETWLSYAVAYTVLSLIPGPSVLMVLGQSLSRGMGAALFCILGDVLGGVVVMSASYIGLGVILATSSAAYQGLKWAGVAYMAWLGISQIIAARRLVEGDLLETAHSVPRAASLRAGFLTGTLNPKAILFYVAFLAQFMDTAYPMTPQFLILMATSMMVVFIVLAGYALLASQAREMMRSIKARKRMGYGSGSLLLGGSALMATSR